MAHLASFGDLGCLVTGASSGIGREIALQLADRGARLAVTARRAHRLEALAAQCMERGAPACSVLPHDLARREDAERLHEAAVGALGAVDVLINNAGFAVPGHFVRSSLGRTLDMLEVNVVAATTLLRLVLPAMVSKGRGGVLNVASVAAFQAAPFQAGYAGTKSYLLNLSESVHQEVGGKGVIVTALCPGVTDTEFFDAAGYKKDLGRFMAHRRAAALVARDGLLGLERGQMTVVSGFSNRALLLLERALPRRVVAAVSRRLMGGRKQ